MKNNRKYSLNQRRTVGGRGLLRAKNPRYKYKNVNTYLDAVYNNNKAYLDERVETFNAKTTKRQQFKEDVKEYMRKGMNVKQAIDEFQRKNAITSKEERIFESNILKMKEMSPKAFRDFKKKIGWKEKIDSTNATFLPSDTKNVEYMRYTDPNTGRDVVIRIEISPVSGIAISYDFMYYEEWKIRDNKNKIKEGVNNSPQLMAENDMLKAILEGKEKLGIYRKEKK